jgi:2-amino-4-hydroxy-6-hydroxymethyldihydropteridine diphosphokinase
MAIAYLGLGSNLGDRESCLRLALHEIRQSIGPVIKRSSIYESEPSGFVSGHLFLNAVVMVETALDAFEILNSISRIEQKAGRVRTGEGYSDRTLDIDLLMLDQQIISSSDIILPHPRMHERLFVLSPLSEIAGELHHPILKKSIQELLEQCSDSGIIRKLNLFPNDQEL